MMTATETDIEELIVGAPECEWDHGGWPPCSEDVLWIIACDCLRDAVLSCNNIVTAVRREMAQDFICNDCLRPMRACWTIRPA